MIIDNIDDYITTEEVPMGFELTNTSDDMDEHTHSFYEIFYVINGQAKHSLTRKDGTTILEDLRECDMVLVPLDDAHCFVRENNSDFTHRDVVIRKKLFIEACSFLSPNLYERICNHLIPTKVNVSLEKISSYEHKIKLLGQIPASMFEQKTLLIRSLLISLLEPFLSQDLERYFNTYPAWFNQLLANFNKIEFMQEGLPRILQLCNYDKKYLCHVFKKYMGVTMTEYLNDIRLNYALELLNNTSITISNIAQHLGFSSVSYFNVIFKKKYGTSPKELRKNKRI